MSAIVQRHLDAIAASLQVTLAHIEAARHAVTLEEPPQAPTRPTRPAQCAGVREDECALEYDGAKRALMGGAYVCTGCGVKFDAHLEGQ